MPLLECRGLVRRFGALVAVDAVDMSLDAGKIRAVIGPNGAGKSTVFNLITSVLKPTAGEVIFAGEKITGLPVHVVAQKGIARTFQLCHIFPALTARENVRIAAQARDAQRWRFVGGGRVRNRSAAIADEALEHMRLTRFAGVAAAMLSHGDQRLLEVAMAIAQKPRLLMLDEPTQGLSLEETDRAVLILKGMLGVGNLSVLLVEHDMEVVFKLADDITVLHRGRVIADGPPAAVKANADVRRAYLGGSECCCVSTPCTPITATATSCRALIWRLRRSASRSCSAATASARPRRCDRSWASHPRAAAAFCSATRTSPGGRLTASFASASATCRRGG